MEPVSIIFYSLVAILILSLVIKFLFWLAAEAGKGRFLKSFFRWYDFGRRHVALTRTKRFMKVSNVINIICWFSFLLAGALFAKYHLTITSDFALL